MEYKLPDYTKVKINIGNMPESWTYETEEGETLVYTALRTKKDFKDEGSSGSYDISSYFDKVVDGEWMIYSITNPSSKGLHNSGHIGTVGFLGKSYDYDSPVFNLDTAEVINDKSGVNDVGTKTSVPSESQEEATRAFCEYLKNENFSWGENFKDDFRDTFYKSVARPLQDIVKVKTVDDVEYHGWVTSGHSTVNVAVSKNGMRIAFARDCYYTNSEGLNSIKPLNPDMINGYYTTKSTEIGSTVFADLGMKISEIYKTQGDAYSELARKTKETIIEDMFSRE